MNKFNQFLGIIKKSGKILEGYNKCEEGIQKKKVRLIIFSENISQNSKDKFIKYCVDYKINCIKDVTLSDIESLQENKNVNVIGITDVGMCNKLLKIWNEKINCPGGEDNGKN